MHSHGHDHFEERPGRRRGPRGGAARFGAWAGPGGGPDGPEGPESPNQLWFGGPFGPGGPAGGFGGHGGPPGMRGWGRGPGRAWGRARRGDIRSAILVLLAERPMHGYEIIGELAERTEGLWRPSPGSIYPTLQLLEDEGLVSAEPEGGAGKRRYTLTDEGRTAVADRPQGPAPWEQMAAGAPLGARDLRHAAASLMPVIGQVAMNGGAPEYAEAVKVLDDARRKLYAILAADRNAPGTAAPSGPTTATADGDGTDEGLGGTA